MDLKHNPVDFEQFKLLGPGIVELHETLRDCGRVWTESDCGPLVESKEKHGDVWKTHWAAQPLPARTTEDRCTLFALHDPAVEYYNLSPSGDEPRRWSKPKRVESPEHWPVEIESAIYWAARRHIDKGFAEDSQLDDLQQDARIKLLELEMKIGPMREQRISFLKAVLKNFFIDQTKRAKDGLDNASSLVEGITTEDRIGSNGSYRARIPVNYDGDDSENGGVRSGSRLMRAMVTVDTTGPQLRDLLKQEHKSLLQAAMSELSDQERQTVLRYYMYEGDEKISKRELATEQGCTEDGIKKRLDRAPEKLVRSMIARYDDRAPEWFKKQKHSDLPKKYSDIPVQQPQLSEFYSELLTILRDRWKKLNGGTVQADYWYTAELEELEETEYSKKQKVRKLKARHCANPGCHFNTIILGRFKKSKPRPRSACQFCSFFRKRCPICATEEKLRSLCCSCKQHDSEVILTEMRTNKRRWSTNLLEQEFILDGTAKGRKKTKNVREERIALSLPGWTLIFLSDAA